jgi:hypothetical protein
VIHVSVVKKMFKPVVVVTPKTANVLRYVSVAIAARILIAVRLIRLSPSSICAGDNLL